MIITFEQRAPVPEVNAGLAARVEPPAANGHASSDREQMAVLRAQDLSRKLADSRGILRSGVLGAGFSIPGAAVVGACLLEFRNGKYDEAARLSQRGHHRGPRVTRRARSIV